MTGRPLPASGAETTSVAYDWLTISGLHVPIEFRIDGLTTMMLAMVTFVSTLVAIFAAGYMAGDPGYARFFACIGLFVFSMTGLVLSSNYFAGEPFNFELVASDGSRAQFSSLHGLIDEVYVAAARTTHGGFMAGELFTGTGVAGQVARISPDGSTVLLPWITLPGETGLLRGALHMDETGVFGGDLLVATDAGSLWRVDGFGNATLVGSAGTALEGLMTLPDDPR